MHDACRNPIRPFGCFFRTKRLPPIDGPVYSEFVSPDAGMQPTPAPAEPLPPPS
jgi:hypothetical protein